MYIWTELYFCPLYVYISLSFCVQYTIYIKKCTESCTRAVKWHHVVHEKSLFKVLYRNIKKEVKNKFL